jgi:hypothetical protein
MTVITMDPPCTRPTEIDSRVVKRFETLLMPLADSQ